MDKKKKELFGDLLQTKDSKKSSDTKPVAHFEHKAIVKESSKPPVKVEAPTIGVKDEGKKKKKKRKEREEDAVKEELPEKKVKKEKKKKAKSYLDDL